MSKFTKILVFSAFRGLGLPLLPKLIQQGFSGNKALAWLKSKGIGYKRQDFQKDWREALGITKKKDTLKHVRKKYLPTSTVIQMTDKNQSARYKMTYKVNAVDTETKAKTDFYVSIVSDKLLIMQEWDDIAEDIIRTENYKQAYEVKSFARESLTEKRLA
jgi:hypothetical protein